MCLKFLGRNKLWQVYNYMLQLCRIPILLLAHANKSYTTLFVHMTSSVTMIVIRLKMCLEILLRIGPKYKLRHKRGVNRGMQIRRSVLFFGPNPSIRRYFRSNLDPSHTVVYVYCSER